MANSHLVPVRAVLNETLRLFPSAPLLSRMSREAPQVVRAAKGGALYLPPNTQVTMLSLFLHRRHDLWGDNADEFYPERWFEEETISRVNATPFMYCPFYGGPRIVESPFLVNACRKVTYASLRFPVYRAGICIK